MANPNINLADAFNDMAREFKKDRYRKRAYENAATSIRKYDKIITSGDQAQKEIKGIGKSIADKIDELLKTGTLQVLENRPQEVIQKDKMVKVFEGIYGVGTITAEKWYDMGYHDFKSLEGLYPQMTDGQKLGYYYYSQLQERIPRPEMDQIRDVIIKMWKPLGLKYDQDYVIAGSYRRGESDSGDIDILVRGIMDISSLLTPLIQNKLILGNLALGPTKYMGIIKVEEFARRIDIRLVNSESWAYALLYFTGSKELNVDMRTKAIGMGLTMNEYGMVGPGREYPAKTEKDIFDYLGMTYLEPIERSATYKFKKDNKTEPPKVEITKVEITKVEIDKIAKVEKSETTKPAITEPMKGKWHRPVPSLFIYISDGLVSTGNIAGFDLDWTLARTIHGSFPKSPSDITLLPNRISTLKKLRERGFTIVIFTNQKSTTENKVKFNFERMNHFINIIPDIPIMLYMSISDDMYRKPQVGMYQTLQKMVPTITSSFYCGDAAGRPQDFSDSDLKFAENSEITFYVPEKIFSSIRFIKPDLGSVNDIKIPDGKNMFVFVGMPGSGKSTFFNTYLSPRGYVHANQDIIGTKAKVLKLVRESITQGLNICVDSTNPGLDRRQEFYNLGLANNYNLITIYFVADGRGRNKLREKPVPTIAYSMYYKYLVEPTSANTPGTLYEMF